MTRRSARGNGRYAGLLYVVPSLAILTLVMLIPIGMTLYFSFTSYSIMGSPQFSGTANYERLASDTAFIGALRNTAIYTLISVPLQTVISLLIAAALAARFRNRLGSFVRSALFIPVMSSMIVIGSVWRFILGSQDSLVSQVVSFLGLDPVNILGNPTSALVAVSLVTVWKNIGYFLVIYYAGIMEIPHDLYEASALDGAGPWRQLWHVTVPSLKPITFLVVILGTIWSFQVFDLVYTMTGGGPGGGTVTLVMAIYDAGFKNYQMGYASAMAVALFAIVLVISIIQRRVFAKEDK